MLRRAVFLLALAAPLAARAVPAAGAVELVPTSFGVSDCSSTDAAVTFSWTITYETGVSTTPSDAFLRILASNTAGCGDSTGTVVTGTVADKITPGTTTSYGATTTVLRKTLVQLSGNTACDKDATIRVCVRLYNAAGTTLLGKADGSVPLVTAAPPAPRTVVAAPGDSALNVSWADGVATTTTATATSYDVSVWECPAGQETTCPRANVKTGSTSNKSLRVSGLTIDHQYKVVVKAFSAEGNPSPDSEPAFGTPINTIDYWELYTRLNGAEQGGCGGGPAGALSLLAVAGLARLLRRRS